MANKFHNPAHQNSHQQLMRRVVSTPTAQDSMTARAEMSGGPPKKPGLLAREQQVAATNEEIRQYRAEDTGPGVTGNVALKTQARVAASGLKRQRNYAKRGSAY